MPELPEVETVRRGLESLVLGTTIIDVQVMRDSCVRGQSGGPAEFAALLQGARLSAAVRRGKFLWFELDDAPPAAASTLALSAHLGMSGQFRVFQGEAPEPHPHCRARVRLAADGNALTLDFIDQRTFGYLLVEPLVQCPDGVVGGLGGTKAAVPASVSHIGRDALDPVVKGYPEAWRKGTRGVKQVLLDQSIVSGVGNIYADESLWLAKVHPQTSASDLGPRKAGALWESVREVMTVALAQGGTSFDALYVNVNGESGYFSRELRAYGQAAAPCERCQTPIAREVIHGRSTHWCPRCQRR